MSKKDKSPEIEDLPLADEAADHTQGEEEIVEELSKEEELEQALSLEKDKFLRLFAEFENYKKRTTRERMELFKTAGQEVLVSILPILDDFDRALVEMDKAKDKELKKGVELIHNKLKETLKAKGLEVVSCGKGDAFDAEIHDAITQIPAPNKKLKGKIIDVVEKGYSLGDKIIRHPKVVVGN
ncbi:MAG: nucleotide exchange factor GrpE [Flavobacteriaceae bacterium]|nr:nucleotide exchange factor GrpE [Flavobacteriaceae bacterium]